MTQEEVREHVFDILKKGHLLSLATVDENGPWVSDLVFIYDGKPNIYWKSDERTRHSQAITKETRVAGTITISNKSKEPNECIQIAGLATKIEDSFELGINYHTKQNKPLPKLGESILEPGHSWYKLTPTIIELIYEPILGRGKKESLVL